jgi:hypothetical protein
MCSKPNSINILIHLSAVYCLTLQVHVILEVVNNDLEVLDMGISSTYLQYDFSSKQFLVYLLKTKLGPHVIYCNSQY